MNCAVSFFCNIIFCVSGSELWSEEASSEPSSGCSVRSRPNSQTSTDTLTCLDLPLSHPSQIYPLTGPNTSNLLPYTSPLPAQYAISPSCSNSLGSYPPSHPSFQGAPLNLSYQGSTRPAQSDYQSQPLTVPFSHTYQDNSTTAPSLPGSTNGGYSSWSTSRSFEATNLVSPQVEEFNNLTHHTELGNTSSEFNSTVLTAPLPVQPNTFQQPFGTESFRHPLAVLHQTPELLSSASSVSSFRVLHHDYSLPVSYSPTQAHPRHSRQGRLALHSSHKTNKSHNSVYVTHSNFNRSSNRVSEPRSSSATVLDPTLLPLPLHLTCVPETNFLSSENAGLISEIQRPANSRFTIDRQQAYDNLSGSVPEPASQPFEFKEGRENFSIIQYQNSEATPGSSGVVLRSQVTDASLCLSDLGESLPGTQNPGDLQATEAPPGTVQPSPGVHGCGASPPIQPFESPPIHQSDYLGKACDSKPTKSFAPFKSNTLPASCSSKDFCCYCGSPTPCSLHSADCSVRGKSSAMSNPSNTTHLATRRVRSLRSHHHHHHHLHHHPTNRPASADGDAAAARSSEGDGRRDQRDRSESPNIRPTMTHHHHHRHHHHQRHHHQHHHHNLRTSGSQPHLDDPENRTENLENVPSDCEDCDDCDYIGGCDECDLIEHHSSEEELETLTGCWQRENTGPPEKRKWSQVGRRSITDSGTYIIALF